MGEIQLDIKNIRSELSHINAAQDALQEQICGTQRDIVRCDTGLKEQKVTTGKISMILAMMQVLTDRYHSDG